MTTLLVGMLSAGVLAVSQEIVHEVVATSATGGLKWVELSLTDPAAKARVYLSGGTDGECNKEAWSFQQTVRAEVAQWIDWEITATQWTWLVRKPGEYFTDCITFKIASNGDVVVSFAGFDNLQRLEEEGYPDGVLQEMSSWFSYGQSATVANSNGWIPAGELEGFTFFDSADLHNEKTFKLWNKIKVEKCHSVGVFENTGTITLTLQSIQPWIDPATGNFRADGNGWNVSDYITSVTKPQL